MTDYEFRLIVRGAEPAAAPVLSIPGPMRLAVNDGKLSAVPLAAQDAQAADICVVQPIHRSQHSPELLLLSAQPECLLLNGIHALPLNVLQAADEVALPESQLLLHVTLYRSAPVGPLPAAMPGKTCALCRGAFVPSASTYRCVCGALLHAPTQADQAESCATMSTDCPACSRPICLAGGYEFWPADLDKPEALDAHQP
ncbi:MAG: hypothetical protein HY343_05100 [Lentisphaerae bacterium]|nr:hypothetical protein [Lentisphaerota bacterium]